MSNSRAAKWFYTHDKNKKAVVLLAHGLNLSPSKMNDLAFFFEHHHCDVLRLDLGTDPKLWEENFKRDFDLAKEHARTQGLPLYFVGFSLGALMGVHYLVKKDPGAFIKMALLAPATHTHLYTVVPALLGHLFPWLSLPSLNLKNYRQRSGTTLLEYKIMFELQKEMKGDLHSALLVPTLFITSPKDELVDSAGLRNWAQKGPLWKGLEISNKSSQLHRKYHHLMIDEASLGQKEWEKLLRSLRSHFDL